MAAGRLGCGEAEAFITFRCGTPRVCSLTNASTITWGRKLDDISEATVSIPIAIGVGGVNPCCDCMSLIEPWCHELHIVRDGVEVWCGPVVTVDYGYNQVNIRAQDVLGWLNERVPKGVLSNADKPFEITDLGLDVLETGFAEDDPCVLEFVYQTDLQTPGGRPTYLGPISVSSDQFPAFQGTVFEWLQTLSDLGLDFTTIGRRIVLGVNSTDLPSAGTLTDEHILGEISVTKNGFLMVNRAIVRYKDDDDQDQCKANAAAGQVTANSVPCPAIIEGPKYCYGLIEKILEEPAAFNIVTAKQFGQLQLNAGAIAPRTVEFPSGTRLHPNAPFDINELIPGMKIKVAFGGLCLETFRDFKLLEIGYTFEDGNEAVTISLGPINAPGSSGTV